LVFHGFSEGKILAQNKIKKTQKLMFVVPATNIN